MAGCARYTAELRKNNVAAMGVDYVRNASRPEAPCVVLDLTLPSSQELLHGMMKAGRIVYVHEAPPCGTASRARERRLAAELLAQGWKQPRPLRSDEHPEGIPGLTGTEAARVQAANQLYAFTAAFALAAHQQGVLWSVENPTRSHMWNTSWYQALCSQQGAFACNFHACMHGGCRKKATTFWTNVQEFHKLALLCDGSHEHAPWGVTAEGRFATAEEAAYPRVLCRRLAAQLVAALRRTGLVHRTMPASGVNLHVRTAANRQFGGARSVPLVPEDKEQLHVRVVSDSDLAVCHGWQRRSHEPRLLAGVVVPAGCRLLDLVAEPQGKRGVAEVGTCKTQPRLATFGVPFSPQEFVERAFQVGHPAEQKAHVHTRVAKAIFAILTDGPSAVQARRVLTLARLKARASELQPAEDRLHEAMPPRIRRVMSGKRILLLKEILDEVGFSDPHLAGDLTAGFALTGILPDAPEFPASQLRPAPMEKTHL